MQFQARAIDGQQAIHDLRLVALDEADARAQLAGRGLTPLTLGEARHWAQRKREFSLLLFAQQFHALVQAGLGVVEALDALHEKETSAELRTILGRLVTAVREGQRLSAALRQQPQYFPQLFAGLVQAAENTSDLPQALERYIAYETRLAALRHKLVSATIYPTLLLIVGGMVALFLMGYVVPRFSAVYQGNQDKLPWASKLLLQWGELAGQHAGALLLGFVAVVAALAGWLRGRWQRQGPAELLRGLPGMAGVRERLQQFELSRLYLTLGNLLEGGIALPQALGLADAVLAPVRRADLAAVRARVEAGEPLSEALAAGPLATPVALRLLRVAERSGQLGPMLVRTAQFYETETGRFIERFTRVFEPLLMAAIGLVIGLIVILLYMPIFELAGSLQ